MSALLFIIGIALLFFLSGEKFTTGLIIASVSLFVTYILIVVSLDVGKKRRLKKKGLKIVTKERVIHHKYDDGFGAYYVDETRTEEFIVPIDWNENDVYRRLP